MANTTRRSFLTLTAFGMTGLGISKLTGAAALMKEPAYPVVLSVSENGAYRNEVAWKILSIGGYALDAVEAGLTEGQTENADNGYFPDSEGKITLDASIMNEKGDAGSVSSLQCIKYPVSVARLVMETTPHVVLSGKGAKKFALKHGFKKEKLLTREIRRQWNQDRKEDLQIITEDSRENFWKQNNSGMLALDEQGRLCGACTSGGMPYEVHGRVGSSSVVGAGLYVDGEVGAAVAVGTGDILVKNLSSFLTVELMRRGMTPAEACNTAIERIVKKISNIDIHQTGIVALGKSGDIGAASLHSGFRFSIKSKKASETREAGAWFKKL